MYELNIIGTTHYYFLYLFVVYIYILRTMKLVIFHNYLEFSIFSLQQQQKNYIAIWYNLWKDEFFPELSVSHSRSVVCTL